MSVSIRFMRRFYAAPENFHDRRVALDAEQTRHLRDVLRLRAGDEISVFDGEGNEFSSVVAEISKNRSVLRVLRETAPAAPESHLNLTLAVALLKGEKYDLVVQKAVELGVSELIPVQTKRCDVKFKDGEKKLERWRKIVVEASKQCGRARLMRIDRVTHFDEIIESAKETRILFAERGGENFSDIQTAGKLTAVVGSEGGWEDSEIEAARSNDFRIVTLGGRILRAETAAIAVAAILQNRFGDLK